MRPEVHLEEGEPEIHALLEPLAGLGAARLLRVGVAIDAHLVAELAAEHLVDRNAIGLAGEVPKRDLDSRDAAALPPMAAELLDAAEQPVDIAGVLAQQPALEHQRIGRAGAVAHFAEADDALVGVDFDQRRGERRADDLGDAHVGDAKCARARRRSHIVLNCLGRFAVAILRPNPVWIYVPVWSACLATTILA